MDTLHADYKGMVEQQMFTGKPPVFGEVVERIRTLQGLINAAVIEHNKKAQPV